MLLLDLHLELKKIVDGINHLHSSISAQNWENAARTVFVVSLDKAIEGLEEMQDKFKAIQKKLEKESVAGAPDLTELLFEFNKTLSVLKNNLKMERGKKSTAKESNVFEKEENAELYNELGQRIQTLLLKARYMTERLNVFAFRQGSAPLEGKTTARQVLDLLQAKENEIEELREKYEDVRKRSYLGYVQEQTSVDLEQDLGGLSVKMGSLANELTKEISMHKNQIQYIENSYAQLKQRLDEVEETFNDYVEKSMELIAMLKKERDYAKKIVLDVEHETVKLRNSYSSELINLQENKLKAKKEAEKKFAKQVEELKKELEEKSGLLKSFRKIAEDKADKEKQLEEKVKKLTLLVKTKEKHEKVKAALKKKSGKKK